ncbi:MAG: DNA-3-methyladenine glycosylase [Flavobacteriales bacterium]
MKQEKLAHRIEPGQRLEKSFYERKEVTRIARELLGKFLVRDVGDARCAGMITETEAYAGRTDRACHAYGGRRTKRTEVMYRAGGTAYVYLCYGIHHLFNVISGPKERPDAVLIRAIEASDGIDRLLRERRLERPKRNWLGGPGKLTHGLGLRTETHNGTDLTKDPELWIEDRGIEIPEKTIHTGSRIGIDYAGPAAELPYRFYLQEKDARHLMMS